MMTTDSPRDSARPSEQVDHREPTAGRELPSAELLQGRSEVLIRHGDDTYRLRLTRNGKLILQK